MSRTVIGPLKHPSGAVIVDRKVRFTSLRHNYSGDGASPIQTITELTTDGSGNFSTDLIAGDYEVHIQLDFSYQKMGIIVIDPAETSTITLGELIDQYRDATGDFSPNGLVTYDQMVNYVGVGGSPADISLLAFQASLANAGKFVRLNPTTGNIEYYTLIPQDVQLAYETATDTQVLQVGHAYYFTPGHTYILPSTPNGGWIEYAWLGDPRLNPVTLTMNGENFNGIADLTTGLDYYVAGRLIHTNTTQGWTV